MIAGKRGVVTHASGVRLGGTFLTVKWFHSGQLAIADNEPGGGSAIEDGDPLPVFAGVQGGRFHEDGKAGFVLWCPRAVLLFFLSYGVALDSDRIGNKGGAVRGGGA